MSNNSMESQDKHKIWWNKARSDEACKDGTAPAWAALIAEIDVLRQRIETDLNQYARAKERLVFVMGEVEGEENDKIFDYLNSVETWFRL